MTVKGKSLMVLTPMYGGVNYVNYFQSFVQLVTVAAKHSIPLTYSSVWNESLITRARNRLADVFMKNSDATHAIFIDADIGFEAEEILSMLERDEDILVAPCSKKSFNWNRIVHMVRTKPTNFTGDQLMRVGGDLVFNFEPFMGDRTLKVTEPWEVRNGGTGIMLIKREVFEGIKERFPDRWYESRSDPIALPGPTHDFFRVGVDPETREYDSEDYVFCTDAKAAGFKVWLCPWVRTTHLGNHLYHGDLPAMSALSGNL